MDAGHGKIETRDCRILKADTIEDKEVMNRWPGLYGDHIATTVRRYISDEDFPKVAYFNMLAHGHWSIENQLHWNHFDAVALLTGQQSCNIAMKALPLCLQFKTAS